MRLYLFYLLLFLLPQCQSPSPLSKASKLVQIHGHRGSRGTHAENSLSAFKEALSAGVDYIELDLVLSRDNTPIVSHDPIVSVDFCLNSKNKPFSRPIPIASLSIKDLKKFKCGAVPNPVFPEQKVESSGASLLTFDEFLQWFTSQNVPNVQLNIETKMEVPKGIKNPSPGVFVDAILNLLKKYDLIERVVLQSFDFRTLADAKKKVPQIKLSLLFEKPATFCEEGKKLNAKMISPAFSLLSEKDLKDCHSLGIEVHPWTLNQESEWKQALNWEVDGIITDYPRRLKTFIQKN